MEKIYFDSTIFKENLNTFLNIKEIIKFSLSYIDNVAELILGIFMTFIMIVLFYTLFPFTILICLLLSIKIE